MYYGLWPYPGANHIGEYLAWSDEFPASTKIQFFFDPVREKPWETHVPPKFVYSFSGNPTGIAFHERDREREDEYDRRFAVDGAKIARSREYGVPIIEAIIFDEDLLIPSLNRPNAGSMPGLMEGMCLEGPCRVNAKGVHPVQLDAELPVAVRAMINLQGAIHGLLIDAYLKKSRNLLLQALLLDPTISTYNNAVALIDEMFDRQAAVLPKLE
jgi:alpha-galactosidase